MWRKFEQINSSRAAELMKSNTIDSSKKSRIELHFFAAVFIASMQCRKVFFPFVHRNRFIHSRISYSVSSSFSILFFCLLCLPHRHPNFLHFSAAAKSFRVSLPIILHNTVHVRLRHTEKKFQERISEYFFSFLAAYVCDLQICAKDDHVSMTRPRSTQNNIFFFFRCNLSLLTEKTIREIFSSTHLRRSLGWVRNGGYWGESGE